MRIREELYTSLEHERAELQTLARLDREDRLLADRVKVLKRELRWLDDPYIAYSRRWAKLVGPWLATSQGVGVAIIISGVFVVAGSQQLSVVLIAAIGSVFNLVVLPSLFRRGEP